MPNYFDPRYTAITSPLGSEEISPVRDLLNGLDKSITLSTIKTYATAGSLPSIQIGTRTFLTELSGNTWLTVNASWDGANWQRVNIAQAAFAINFQSASDIQGETNTKGIIIWRATPAANPIGTTFGSVGGWEILQALTEYKDWVCGGFGLEVDGNGTVPYGRFVHYSNANTPPIRTGVVKNLFAGMGAVDDATKPSWFAGFKDDSFVIERAAIGQTTSAGLTTLLTLTSAGNISIAGTGLGGGGSSTTVGSSIKTVSYTFALADAGTVVEMNVASANTITIPPNSSVAFPVGTVMETCQIGLGQTSVVAGAGVTIRNPGLTLAARAQWSTLSLRQRIANEWVLAGDMA